MGVQAGLYLYDINRFSHDLALITSIYLMSLPEPKAQNGEVVV